MFFSRRNSKKSYAQCGEDLIIDFVFENCFHISKPTYLDVGAHDPVYLNNTFYFYQKGSNGVLVEPDPVLWEKIKRKRPKDICLNVGAGTGTIANSEFFVMDCSTLNTFSREDAERYKIQEGHKIEKVVSLPIVSINDIIEGNFTNPPNFVSLDVEGLEIKILQSFDFKRFRPEIFCVETLTYTKDFSGIKLHETIDVMVENGYFVYADTYINTILIDKRAWKLRSNI